MKGFYRGATFAMAAMTAAVAMGDPARNKDPTAAEIVTEWKTSSQGRPLMEMVAMATYNGFLWALAGRDPKPFCFHGNAPQTGRELLGILDVAVTAEERVADLPYGEVLFVALQRLFPCRS